jgi:hypothetical protein
MWLGIALMLAPVCLVQAQTKKKQTKADPFLTGPPWTFEDVLRGVGALFPARLEAAVEARGVDFFPTEAEEKQLRQAGAPETLIELIEKKGASYKPPPPPKPVTAGVLTLTCAPVECNIEINGKPAGFTKAGVKHVEGLVIGPAPAVIVDFKKEGYIGQQVSIPLKAGVAVAKAVTLAPTIETQEKFGHDALNSVLLKLGGKEGWRDVGMLRAAGSANLFQTGGTRSEWSVDARLNAQASMAYLEISGAGLKYWISLKGSDSKVGGSGKLKGGPVALEMEKIVRQYRELQPITLLSRIVNQKMTVIAPSPFVEGGAEVTLKASGATESYTLTITPGGLPARAVYESASGLGSGLSVVYGDYVNVGKGKLPRVMDIRFADQAQHGMEFHFETITSDPKLSDKEFHR